MDTLVYKSRNMNDNFLLSKDFKYYFGFALIAHLKSNGTTSQACQKLISAHPQ